MEKPMERPGLVLRAARGHQPVGAWSVAQEAPVSIGAWDGATLHLDDPDVLPVHAVLDPTDDGRWRLISLAPDGCTLNGQAVRRALISPGDQLGVGPYSIVLDSSGPARARPARSSSRANALRARLMWRGTPLDVRVLRPGDLLVVGQGREATFPIAPELLGHSRAKAQWVVAAAIDGAWHVALDSPLRAVERHGRDVPLLTASARTDGPNLGRRFEPVRTWTALPEDTAVRLDAGALSIELERCEEAPLERRRQLPWWITPEGQRSIVGAMVLLFLVAILQLEVVLPFRPEDEASRERALIAQFQRPVAMTPEQQERVERWRKRTEEKEEPGGAARAQGEEGRAGRPDATAQNARRAGPRSDAELVREHALLKALAQAGTVDRLAGGGVLGAANALGNLQGSSVGDAQGTLGLGLKGTGHGGGGLSADTVGVGPVGTRGMGSGEGGFGRGAGRLGRDGPSELGMDEPERVEGGLDREVIRRVILSHRAQIRYCYEKQLAQSPDLAGKVLIEFVIGADGRVSTARAAEQTLSDPEVGRCIASKVKTWTFPQPRGGGVVVVTYPFLFKPAGRTGGAP